ncbi:hypothetical protein HRbin05_00728 [archaeon HR05]|nr:hypothetical protein HRbin05_00728 [archaeon HR05]
MLPNPLATLLVALSSLPSVNATLVISPGVPVTGSNAISTSGIPNLSRAYVLTRESSPTSLAASSSRHMLCTLTSLSPSLNLTLREPPIAISIVLWNPVVLEPSMTILRITCTSSTTSALSASDIIRAVSNASLLRSCGGSSSISTKHDVPFLARYLITLPFLNSKSAAGSY